MGAMTLRLRHVLFVAGLVQVGSLVADGSADDTVATDSFTDFHWISTERPAGRYLIPNDWQATRSRGKLLESVVIRPIHGRATRHRWTKMTVNPVSELSKIHGRLVSQQIKDILLTTQSDQRKSVESVSQVTRGDYRGPCIRFRETRDSTELRVMRCYLGNDGEDLLLVIEFQSSVENWTEAWQSGRKMLAALRLGVTIEKSIF